MTIRRKSSTVFPQIVSAETIQGRKLFKSGNYMRKYGILLGTTKRYLKLKTLGFFVISKGKLKELEYKSRN